MFRGQALVFAQAAVRKLPGFFRIFGMSSAYLWPVFRVFGGVHRVLGLTHSVCFYRIAPGGLRKRGLGV